MNFKYKSGNLMCGKRKNKQPTRQLSGNQPRSLKHRREGRGPGSLTSPMVGNAFVQYSRLRGRCLFEVDASAIKA